MASKAFENEILDKVVARFKEFDIEHTVLEDEEQFAGHRLIRGMFACKGGDEGHVVSEICTIEQDEDAPYVMVQIFTTIAEFEDDADGTIFSEFLTKANEWNLYNPLGYYSVYEESNHFYSKYDLLIHPKLTSEEASDMILETLGVHLTLVGKVYDEVWSICEGEGDISSL